MAEYLLLKGAVISLYRFEFLQDQEINVFIIKKSQDKTLNVYLYNFKMIENQSKN